MPKPHYPNQMKVREDRRNLPSIRRVRQIVIWGLSTVFFYKDLRFQLSHLKPKSTNNLIQTSTGTRSKILVFYNLFVAGAEDVERVQDIFDEQLTELDPRLHVINASITSLGHPLPNIPNHMIREHIAEGGDEGITLNAIWNYCRSNNNHETKVIYLHSKGSFHPSEKNDKLRRFITEGALSEECANLPDTCDVCSSRMSPLPHSHTSGNMWLARCDYVAKLVRHEIVVCLLMVYCFFNQLKPLRFLLIPHTSQG
jgi:hypothetical protein